MLVYSSSFTLEPQDGPQQIVNCVARWAGMRSNRSSINSILLSKGIIDLRLNDGSLLTSRVTLDELQKPVYPYLFCAQLSHGDNQVSGRHWITEIGFRQEVLNAPITCTVLLKTDEVSARVTAPIQATRPKVVEQLTKECNPSFHTPGMKIKRLDEESAAAFLIEVERQERRNPIVVVSCNRNGDYLVMPERIRSLLVGVADVVAVPVGVDTFKIEEVLGRRYGAWGGAINIIFQARRGKSEMFCETVLYRQNDLANLVEEDKIIESEILAAVTHRTNLFHSWGHISLDVVSHAILRGQLAKSIQRARQSDDSAEYVELLEFASKELQSKDKQVADLHLDIDELDGQVRTQMAVIGGLKHALSGRQSSMEANEEDLAVLTPLREAVTAVLEADDPSLEQSVNLINMLFSERIVFLDSAYDSAQKSDADNFRYGNKALNLLLKLANGYWQALAEGKGDQHAKGAFGHNAYAQNEGQALSNEGKRRRTFTYRDRDFLMEKHLKIGIKDSATETLRIHFEWLAEEKRLVVGYCGKHLDF